MFSVSVFSFSKNKLNPNKPWVSVWFGRFTAFQRLRFGRGTHATVNAVNASLFFFSRVLGVIGYCASLFSRKCWLFHDEQCICALFTDPQISLFSNFFIKNESHGTIHIFKNYFIRMFLVFNKISCIQMNLKIDITNYKECIFIYIFVR